MEKVKDIVNSGELEHLTGERIWLELYKTTDVDRFYIELSKLGAAGIFGEIIDTIPIDDLKPTNKIQDVACFMFSRVVNIDEFFCLGSKFRFKMGLICESKLYLVSHNWHFGRSPY